MSRCDANSQYLHQEPQDSPQSDAELHLYPVKLQAILNPSTLYVRLLIEEQLPCNERVLMLQSIGEMQRRLNELCDNDINYATNENHMAETRKLIGKLNKNSFCAVLHQDKWHRGIIIDIISYSKKLSYKILLIDHGKLIFSDPSKLRDLAAPFRDSFILIKQLIIDKIQPLLLSNSSLQASQGSSDEDWRVNKNLWSIASVKYLKEFIKDKELYVSIDKEIDQSIYGDLYYENKNEVKGNSHHARIFESFSKCLIKNNFAKSKYISRDLQPPILCNSILSKPLNPAIFPPQKDIDLPKKSNGYVEQQNNSKLGLNGEFFDMGNYFENLMNDSAANNQEINSYDSWHMNIDDPPSQPRRATSSAELENYSIIDTALISNVRRLNSTNLEFKSFKYLPHIDNFIAKYLRTKYPTLCQMYFDLLVKKHKDFLIVSPRQSGKTTIYQLHIVNDLLETIHRDSLSNRSLSLNQKVKALIVCDSWITCFECVESNRLLLSSFQNQIHLQSLSNINHPIESLEITMYNGVDILYLTPKMLLHLYSLNLLRFDELRYLIFENSDIIFNQFGNEIKELYQKMRVKNNRFQTILLSKSFDPGMSKFYHSLSKTNNFSETIISNSEKFAYTQIEIVIKYANVNSYANIVLNSIAPLIQDHSSYITIVSHINILLENLEKFFNEKEIHAERIDCKSLDYDVECKLSRIFNKLPNQSRPTILLLNDHHIHKIGHNDSNMIISIGLPDSKNEWSDRIELGFDHLSKSLKQSDSQANNLRFIQIIMDTDNSRHIQQLLHLFKRCNVSKDSSDLQILYSQLISENSTNSNFDICRYYNQFGRCPNENVCAIRHTFKLTDFEHSFTIHSANRESPSLQINEGNIANLVQNLSDKYSLLNCDFLKVSARVIYCQSPSVLFISIKSIEMPDDKKTTDGTPLTSEEINKDVTPKKYDFRHASFSLDSKMSKFFAVPDNRKLLNDISCVNINLLYALFNDKTSTYHRVKILKIPADVNYFKQQKCILVQFVDDGYKDYVAQISLFYLPSHLAQIEPLAIELVLCNIQPVDRSFEWPPSIAEKTSKLLKNSEIEFVPELITKQTIFTASFRMSSNYSHMNRPMLNLEFPMHFFDNNMALPSPDHINTLLEQKNSLKNIIETEGIEMLQVPPEYMAEPASMKEELDSNMQDLSRTSSLVDELSIVLSQTKELSITTDGGINDKIEDVSNFVTISELNSDEIPSKQNQGSKLIHEKDANDFNKNQIILMWGQFDALIRVGIKGQDICRLEIKEEIQESKNIESDYEFKKLVLKLQTDSRTNIAELEIHLEHAINPDYIEQKYDKRRQILYFYLKKSISDIYWDNLAEIWKDSDQIFKKSSKIFVSNALEVTVLEDLQFYVDIEEEYDEKNANIQDNNKFQPFFDSSKLPTGSVIAPWDTRRLSKRTFRPDFEEDENYEQSYSDNPNLDHWGCSEENDDTVDANSFSTIDYEKEEASEEHHKLVDDDGATGVKSKCNFRFRRDMSDQNNFDFNNQAAFGDYHL